MSTFVELPLTPIILEFTGPSDTPDQVAIAIKHAVKAGSVLQIGMQLPDGEFPNYVGINFAAAASFNVRSTDPREEDRSPETFTYATTLVEFLQGVIAEEHEDAAYTEQKRVIASE